MPEYVKMVVIDDNDTMLTEMARIFDCSSKSSDFREKLIVEGAANLTVTSVNPSAFNVAKALELSKALALADIVLLDVQLGSESNTIWDCVFESKKSKEFSLIVYTGQAGNVDKYRNLFGRGATLIIEKRPDTNEKSSFINLKLLVAGEVNRILRERNERKKAATLGQIINLAGMVILDPEMQVIADKIRRISDTDISVLITGESGCGKECIAKAIHSTSRRKDEKFLAINCGAFTESLLASELFGYEKGAFTGATARKSGLIEAADRGTLFLDEVADMSSAMQVKLLRVLQEHTFLRVGGTSEVKANVRIIAATNKDIQNLTNVTGEFRKDLYYRICGLPISVPPLRNRKIEIPAIATQFINNRSKELSKSPFDLTKDTIDHLARYDWPGNIRELQNILEQAIVLATDQDSFNKEILSIVSGSQQASYTTEPASSLSAAIDQTEKRQLVEAMKKLKSGEIRNKRAVAAHLGCDHNSFYQKMKKHGLSLNVSDY